MKDWDRSKARRRYC